MDVYSKLRDKLNRHPVGVPELPEILEILRILFSASEAEFALTLGITPKPIEEIAAKANMKLDSAVSLGESLANKGLVLSYVKNDTRYYGLLPIMPGVFEYPFMKRKLLDLDFTKLARLWHDYYDKGFGQEYHGGKTSMSRVIAIKQSIDSKSSVLPFDDVSYYIEKANSIAVGDCSCRAAEKKCDNPIRTCLAFDSGASFLVERRISDFITKREAYRILEITEKAGLVHMTSNTANKLAFICNCCTCCCVTLGYLTRLKNPGSHPSSNFVAQADVELCNSCGACVERCPAKAVRIAGSIHIDTKLCIGCGLCASACQVEAVKLIRRPDSADPPADARALALRVAEEKGRLDAFLANL